MEGEPRKVRVLELFSGIGGMHYSLLKAENVLHRIDPQQRLEFDIVSAMDINDVANKVYRHNFSGTSHLNKNICGVKVGALESLKVDAIFMSPPCQPFTRQGLKKDLKDTRTEPLSHLLTNVIPNLKSLKYILIENVKGFETSDAHSLLIAAIKKIGFSYQELLLKPTTLGIPNSRLRYYLIGKRSPEVFAFDTQEEFQTDLSFVGSVVANNLGEFLGFENRPTLDKYLESLSPEESDLFKLKDKTLEKYSKILDIVRPDSTSSCCFTKAYSKYAEGTGSVIQEIGDFEFLTQVYKSAESIMSKNEENLNDQKSIDESLKDENSTEEMSTYVKLNGENSTEQKLSVEKSKEEKANDKTAEFIGQLRRLGLRYFTPDEIARILGFPVDKSEVVHFEFPPDFPRNATSSYRLLGNSLSVTVVSILTTLLFIKSR